jgi:hypothetical protein
MGAPARTTVDDCSPSYVRHRVSPNELSLSLSRATKLDRETEAPAIRRKKKRASHSWIGPTYSPRIHQQSTSIRRQSPSIRLQSHHIISYPTKEPSYTPNKVHTRQKNPSTIPTRHGCDICLVSPIYTHTNKHKHTRTHAHMHMHMHMHIHTQRERERERERERYVRKWNWV